MVAVKNRTKRFEITLAIKIFIIVILALTVILPLFFIFPSISKINVKTLIFSKSFLSAVSNSFMVGIVSTLISLILAFSLSFILSRVNMRLTGILSVIFCLPMLIPSIAHGMAMVVLFGNSGIITRLFGLEQGLNGFWAIVFGSVLYSFPTAFLMLGDIFKYEDRSVYEAADIMGIPKRRQFLNITLPYMAKPLISVVFAVFTLVFTDYGVAMMVGGRFTTLPLYMYNEVIGQLNFGVGAVVAIVLIIPAIGAFLFDIFKKEAGNINYIRKEKDKKYNKKKALLSYIYCGLATLIIVLPIVLFSLMGFVKKYPTNMNFSLANLSKVFDMKGGQFLGNSLLISLLVGVIGTIITFFTAYLTARVPSKLNKYLHLISIISLAIPGMVLGISYSLTFKSSFLMGTILMLVMVNTVHFFSSPYLMCYNAMNKINKNYEIVAKTMQVNRMRLIKDVILPLSTETIVEMFAYFFVNSMVTISAVSFLATSGSMPLSLMINMFETQMLIECAAVVSFMILLVNGLLKTAIYLYKRIKSRRILKEDMSNVK